jgi:hypothetical protein
MNKQNTLGKASKTRALDTKNNNKTEEKKKIEKICCLKAGHDKEAAYGEA